ncbi:MAG: endolytic transglycosylase MltG [Candidatus Saccharimonadales bacterium]
MDIRPPKQHKPTQPTGTPPNSKPFQPSKSTEPTRPVENGSSNNTNESLPEISPIQPSEFDKNQSGKKNKLKKSNKPKGRKKKGLIVLVVILVLLLGSLAWSYYWYNSSQAPVSGSQEDIYISIESGMSSVQIANLLENEGVIRSSLAFRLQARLMGVSHQIQAGFYSLSPDQTLEEVIEILTSGAIAQMIVRIPSGSIIDTVVDTLSNAGFSGGEVRAALTASYDYQILRDKPAGASLEGYLFPDTYHAAGNATAEEVIEMILANTEEKITQDIIDRWAEMGLNIHQGLTLASIVHKESPTEDMPAIAGVFWNRLNSGMKLQSDATVNYALGTSNLQPSIADTEINHPYNTYRIDGLPPGPVGNPELVAITASANPIDHDWYFFLHRPSGETVFSTTFEEHDINRQRYLDGQQ